MKEGKKAKNIAFKTKDGKEINFKSNGKKLSSADKLMKKMLKFQKTIAMYNQDVERKNKKKKESKPIDTNEENQPKIKNKFFAKLLK